jgi:hypothetical protein
MYGHGFYWFSNDAWHIYMNFEENSHSLQREIHPEIPAEAKRCGFDPVNGQAVSNDSGEMPQIVKDEIERMFVTYFPDRESLKRWIRHNYGANYDREEWNYQLGFLLSSIGISKAYAIEDCKKQAEGYKQVAEQPVVTIRWDDLQWLEHFLKIFDQYPNDYWSEKNIPVEREYQKEVKIKVRLNCWHERQHS